MVLRLFGALALWLLSSGYAVQPPPQWSAFAAPNANVIAAAASSTTLLREKRQASVSCNTTMYTNGIIVSPGTNVPMMCYWYLIPSAGTRAAVQFLTMDFGPCKNDSNGFPIDYVAFWRYLSLRGPYCGSALSSAHDKIYPGKWTVIFKTAGTTGMSTSAFTAAFGSTAATSVCTYSDSYMQLQGCDLNGISDVQSVRFCCGLNATLADKIISSELPASFSIFVDAVTAARTASWYFGACFTVSRNICGIGFTYSTIGFGAGYSVRLGTWNIATMASAPTGGTLCVSRGPITGVNITERLPCQAVTTAPCAVVIVPPSNNFEFRGFAVYSQ